MFSAFKNCSGNDNDPVIVYVSKMFSVLPGSISAHKHRYVSKMFSVPNILSLQNWVHARKQEKRPRLPPAAAG